MTHKKTRSLIYSVVLSALAGLCLASPHATVWGGRRQTEVKTETKRDVSTPLKDIPPKHVESGREPLVRPLRRINSAAAAAAAPQVTEVIPAVKNDVSPELRVLTPRRAEAGPFKRVIPLRRIRPETEGLRRTAPVLVDRAEPTAAAPLTLVPAVIERNFNGVGVDVVIPIPNPPPNPLPTPFRPSGSPPDTSGVVGETQYVQWVNTSFAVFDKATGALVYGPADGNTLWTGFGGPCETSNDGDPVAQYDKIARRWVLSQFSVSGVEPDNQNRPAFRQCIAVSTSPDATGTYNRYEFKYDAFNDYPKMGVWPDGYYVTFNMFEGSDGPFIGSRVCVYDRTKMLAGQEGRMMCQQFTRDIGGVLPSDLDGASTSLNAPGSTGLPPAGSPNYLLNFGRNSLRVWKLKVNWAPPPAQPTQPPPSPTMTLTGPTLVAGVLPFNEACDSCVPQRDVTQQLDTLGDRLMFRLAYRRFPDGHEALVANHAVTASNGSVGIRWYELRVADQSVTLFQQGTFAPDADHRWIGSIAMDRVGNIGLGYNVSGNRTFPEIRFTGRPPGTSPPLGQMQGERVIITGRGSQTSFSRWGDYSNMTVDPVNDCTMWFTTQYLNSTGRHNWSTRVASFRFTSCN